MKPSFAKRCLGSAGGPSPWQRRNVAALLGLAVASTILAGGPVCAQTPQEPPAQQPAAPPAGNPSAGNPSIGAQQPGAGGTAAEAPGIVRGQLISRYWLRAGGDTSDQDIYETLSLDLGDERKHPVTGHLLARVNGDLDGRTKGDSQFFGLEDAVGGNLDGRLYDAYADLHFLDGLQLVRLGRQRIDETPELAFFDGAHVLTKEIGDVGLQFGGYGGVSSHLFEASADGDWMAGVYGQLRPWSGARLRLDWMHLEDKAFLGAHENDLLGAGLWQNWNQIQLEGHYTRLENHDRDVRGRLAWNDPDAQLVAQATYYQLLETEADLVLELDPFFHALHELFPFRQFGGMVGKGIGDHVDLAAGVDLRRVTDQADAGTFNRDYERSYGTVNLHGWPVKGLSMSVTGDVWHSDQQTVSTWGFDVGYEVTAATRASVGSYYSLYKFDLFVDTERDHVRTYFCKVQHKMSKAWSFDGSYELEQSDLDDYHLLRLGATWRF